MDPDLLPPNIPLVLFNLHSAISDKSRYRIICLIGTFAGGEHNVYKAAVLNPSRDYYDGVHVEDVFVTVKCLNAAKYRKAYAEMRREAELNRMLPTSHENIIRIEKPFFSPNNDYCVIFPYMGMGSMRHILRTKFPDGMPEDLLLVVLRETLKGLSFIHQYDRAHGQVNTGNIFLSRKPSIKLSFSGSIFTPTEDQELPVSSSSSLPIDSICEWAAAPEVYNEHPCHYTAKTDVWMVGITALELACGGLHEVPDRETLENTVQEILCRRRFPKEEKETIMKKLLQIVKASSGGSDGSGGRPMMRVSAQMDYSNRFQEMVAACLEWNHGSRPTVNQLLQTSIMRKNLGREAMYFYGMTVDYPVRLQVR